LSDFDDSMTMPRVVAHIYSVYLIYVVNHIRKCCSSWAQLQFLKTFCSHLHSFFGSTSTYCMHKALLTLFYYLYSNLQDNWEITQA